MKPTNFWQRIFSIAVKGGILSLAVLAMLPFTAQAQCQRWDVSGKWKIKLGTGAIVDVNIKGKSAKVSYEAIGGGGTDDNITVDGNDFGLFLTWDLRDTMRGTNTEVYGGKIAADGKISGVARVFGHLTVDTPWTSDRAMVCAESGRFKPIHKLKITPGAPAEPEVPPAEQPATPTTTTPPTANNTPMIRASSNNVVVRLPKTEGKTTLTWDGGKDHPYAEVWVKIDDADETFVVEQGAGSRQVTIEAGKTYLYILTDAGKTLATVTVKFRQGNQVRPNN